ncbi:hypothetical protein T440DRAFT_466602 [Plenodomus tracheiphilus IPT5]|uniref:Protein kinase domain-containing protein n=1 Tax=Plenodomus tracheiphilus IPT5 TaxID=1408161 RepID=A0A6A7BE27_9PLEO|nr:hypothetical protein T440DRAFT_466602 [Plenodomus tracheiphilus IPT5]
MDITSLALSAFSAAVQIIEIGVKIHNRVKNEAKLNALLREVHIFEVEDQRRDLVVTVKLAQAVLDNPRIDREDKERLDRDWKRITGLLDQVDKLIDKMLANSSWTKTRKRRRARDELLDIGGTKKLSAAIGNFRLSVTGLRDLGNDDPDIFLNEKSFRPIDAENRVTESTVGAVLGQGLLTKERRGVPDKVSWFLYEPKPYPLSKRDSVKEDLIDLAQKLAKAQPGRGIPHLLGFRDASDDQQGRFELIFSGNFTDKYPQTLSRRLQDDQTIPSLNYRVSLCHQLAVAVLQTETLRLVHKNIRPENIFLLPDGNLQTPSTEKVPSLFLHGWHYARGVEEAATSLMGEVSLQRRIYQHPERQIQVAEKRYNMGHDVYSLGVCMLEIITWKSLLAPVTPPTVSATFTEAFNWLKLDTNPNITLDRYAKSPLEVKAVLYSMAEKLIPREAGNKMADMVKNFLTCLDDIGVGGADKEDDDDDEAEDETVVSAEQTIAFETSNSKHSKEVAIRFVDTTVKVLQDLTLKL